MVGKVLERGSKRAARLANNAFEQTVGATRKPKAPPAAQCERSPDRGASKHAEH